MKEADEAIERLLKGLRDAEPTSGFEQCILPALRRATETQSRLAVPRGRLLHPFAWPARPARTVACILLVVLALALGVASFVTGFHRLRENLVAGKETAGPSTSLRSGRDDKLSLWPRFGTATELSSRPERSEVEGPAVSFPTKAERKNPQKEGFVVKGFVVRVSWSGDSRNISIDSRKEQHHEYDLSGGEFLGQFDSDQRRPGWHTAGWLGTGAGS